MAQQIQHVDPASTPPSLKRLSDHIGEKQRKGIALTQELDTITKDLRTLGFKIGDPLGMTRLPLDEQTIDKAIAALKGEGMNVKSLQKALGIFDYTEMTRTRKALAAAGVTRETENYRGTNATFIELNLESMATANDGPSVNEQPAGTDDKPAEATQGTAPEPAAPTTSVK